MPNTSVNLIRAAYDAYATGDLAGMLDLVDPDLEWTYLDPSLEDPDPQVCHGRHELEAALRTRAALGLGSELEEIQGNGDRVMVVVRARGMDDHHGGPGHDRAYVVLTVRGGRIVALRDCRDRNEALRFAGLG